MAGVYRALADCTIVVHLAFVGYVVVGLVLILLGILFRWGWVRNFWFRATHVLAICFVAFEAMIGMECPLTTWENQLRAAAGIVGLRADRVGGVDLSGRVLARDRHPQVAGQRKHAQRLAGGIERQQDHGIRAHRRPLVGALVGAQ